MHPRWMGKGFRQLSDALVFTPLRRLPLTLFDHSHVRPIRLSTKYQQLAEESMASLFVNDITLLSAGPSLRRDRGGTARRTTCIGCDIVEEIGLAASTTSEHLRILKEAGVIVGEIERPRICYSLNAAALKPLAKFLDQANARLLPKSRD